MEVFVARQPIFTTHQRVFGYELLFRDGTGNVFPEGFDPDDHEERHADRAAGVGGAGAG